MSKPVLSQITGIAALVKNQPWAYQPAVVSGGPVAAWTAVGLPPGITINATSGRLSGAPEIPGTYVVTLKARDSANVYSDPLILPIGVETIPFEVDGAIRLNVNVQTGAVYSPDNTANVPLYAKAGDQILVSIGFEDGGTLQEIPMMALITVSMKVWDDDDDIVLNDGLFIKTGDYDSTRYVTMLDFTDPRIRDAFDEFESRQGTGFAGLCEVNWLWYTTRPGFNDPQPMNRTSRNFQVTTFRDLDPVNRTAAIPS